MKVILSTNMAGAVVVTSLNWRRRDKDRARAALAHDQVVREWAQRSEACRRAGDAVGAAEPPPAPPEIVSESDAGFIARQAAKAGISAYAVADHADLPPQVEIRKGEGPGGTDVHVDLQKDWTIEGAGINPRGRAAR